MQLPSNKWGALLETQVTLPYFQSLHQFIITEYNQQRIYPKQEQLFNALQLTDFDQVKVVILGQDPYHGDNQAHGLAFSVPGDMPIPPSLKNMFKELEADLGVTIQHTSGDLTEWAKQGVLLLNTVLSVRAGEAFSHKQRGWEILTDFIISSLNAKQSPIVFVLWGKPAQQKKKLISKHHIIIESAHPSPLSAYRGFLGSKPYSTINKHLIAVGEHPIDWSRLQQRDNNTIQTTLF